MGAGSVVGFGNSWFGVVGRGVGGIDGFGVVGRGVGRSVAPLEVGRGVGGIDGFGVVGRGVGRCVGTGVDAGVVALEVGRGVGRCVGTGVAPSGVVALEVGTGVATSGSVARGVGCDVGGTTGGRGSSGLHFFLQFLRLFLHFFLHCFFACLLHFFFLLHFFVHFLNFFVHFLVHFFLFALDRRRDDAPSVVNASSNDPSPASAVDAPPFVHIVIISVDASSAVLTSFFGASPRNDGLESPRYATAASRRRVRLVCLYHVMFSRPGSMMSAYEERRWPSTNGEDLYTTTPF